jgi:hypothetical protein
MKRRGGRTEDSRRVTGQGGIVVKRCRGCEREVLSSDKGEVTAVGKGEIERVRSNGDVVGRCYCGRPVVWERERVRPKPPPRLSVG